MKAFVGNRSVRVAAIIVGVVAIIGLVGVVVPRPAAQPVSQDDSRYRSATISRGDIRETVSATGAVEAKQRSALTFLLGGRVEQINVTEGQRARKDDLLLRLDTSQLELDLANAQLTVDLQQVAYNQLVTGAGKYDVIAARAAVARSAAQLAQLTAAPDETNVRLAQTSYEQAQNNLWRAQAARDRVLGLFLANILPQNQLDEVTKEVESAELAVKIAEQQVINIQQGASSADVASARASLAQSQASLNRLVEGPTAIDVDLARVQIDQAVLAVESARLSMDNAQIAAPFDGIVAEVSLQLGEQATPGLPAVIFLDDSSYHIDLLVDEVDIARIQEGQLAFIRLDASPGENITGHVSRIAPDGVTVRGVVSYEVSIEIDTASAAIKDGMTATVDVVVSELTNVLLVPNWAIRLDRGANEAFVNVRHADGTIEEVKIVLGTRGETMSEVLDGLSEGDTVVVSLERENPFGPSGQNP